MHEYQPNQLLTVKEVVGEYRVGRTYLYEAVKRGELTARSFGKRGTRFVRSDVDAWIVALPTKNMGA